MLCAEARFSAATMSKLRVEDQLNTCWGRKDYGLAAIVAIWTWRCRGYGQGLPLQCRREDIR